MEILDWAEGNAEKLVQKYLDAEPNEVFSQNELKNKGDYYIGTESSGDGETVFVDICFGDEFEKHDNNLEKNYEYFTRFAEDISDNMNYDVSVMTNSDAQTILFQFTDWFPEESEEPEEYDKGGKVDSMKKEWMDFVKENRGYFQIDEETDDMIHLNTREHGSIGDEQYGQEDVDFARYIIKKVREKYPKTKARLYDIDEWIDLELTYVEDESKKPKKVNKKKYYKDFQNYVTKNLKGQKINGWDFEYGGADGTMSFKKNNLEIKATPFWDSKEIIPFDVIKNEDDFILNDVYEFKPNYDLEDDLKKYKSLVSTFIWRNDGREFAKGGQVGGTEEVKNFKSELLKKYGNGGDYEIYFRPSGASSDEINKAVNLYLDLFSENGSVVINGQTYKWEGGKRIDESIVKDIMLYNRGANNFAELYYGDVAKRAITNPKMADGGELEDDTFVMLFKGYGFVEQRGSYGTKTFYNRQHNAKIYYDPKYRSISGYVGGGEGNDEVIPYSVDGVLDFFIEHDISESEATPLGTGGMTVGRWYPDKTGEEFRYIGEDLNGKSLFNDGQKVIFKPIEDFESAPKEKKLFKFFRLGGALKEDFLEDVAEMHDEIKEITLKDGSKITHDELMEAHQFLEPDETQEYYASMQYGKGGTFDSKVQSISKKLVGKPVPKQYRKEYGSRYDKEDAQEAARRIVGNMRKLYGE